MNLLDKETHPHQENAIENKFKTMVQWTVKINDEEMDHFCLRDFSLLIESSSPVNG